MTKAKDLDLIEYEAWRIIELGRRMPEKVVPQYPTWTLRDLVIHVAGVHGRTADICETLPAEQVAIPPLPDEVDPFDWAATELARMLIGLAHADPGTRVWTFVADRSLDFWRRRMVIETGVHRWDAQLAATEPEPLFRRVSRYGLDEFDQLYLPRLGDVPTLELRATDLGRTWRYGDGDPVATVEGPASDLFLRLMSRLGVALPNAWEEAVDALGSPADR